MQSTQRCLPPYAVLVHSVTLGPTICGNVAFVPALGNSMALLAGNRAFGQVEVEFPAIGMRDHLPDSVAEQEFQPRRPGGKARRFMQSRMKRLTQLSAMECVLDLHLTCAEVMAHM